MKLTYSDLNFELQLSCESPTILIIENKSLFSKISADLWGQSCGTPGDIILSQNNEQLKPEKVSTVIINPFSINYNEKRILTAVYKEFCDIANDIYFEKTAELNSKIISLLDSIEKSVDSPVIYDIELDFKNLLKVYNVRIDDQNDNFLDRIVSYIKLLHRICNIQLFIFLNLKSFFTEDQLIALYKETLYENVILLDIEGYDSNYHLTQENYVIIDKDLCIITP